MLVPNIDLKSIRLAAEKETLVNLKNRLEKKIHEKVFT